MDFFNNIAKFLNFKFSVSIVKQNAFFKKSFNTDVFKLRFPADARRGSPSLKPHFTVESNFRPYFFFSKSAETSLFKIFLAKFSLFKLQFFSKFFFTESWAFLSHLFWFKTRVSYFMNNWIYTTNHKRIAVNYFWFVILSGIVGMVLATLIRLEFAYPGAGVFVGDSLQYLSMATAHGVIMVFFMIMPLLFGAFANFLLPTQLGVHDVAFPRLNSAAFWFLPGGLLMLCQLVCVDKRYQRMNCFNIREIQSILKKKFFPNLINSHDRHDLLSSTAIGLRFKTSPVSSIFSNSQILFNFGVDYNAKTKLTMFQAFSKPSANSSLFLDKNSLNYKFLNQLDLKLGVDAFSLFNIILLKLSKIMIQTTLFLNSPIFNFTLFFSKVLSNFSFFLFSLFNGIQIFAVSVASALMYFSQFISSCFNLKTFFNEVFCVVKSAFFFPNDADGSSTFYISRIVGSFLNFFYKIFSQTFSFLFSLPRIPMYLELSNLNSISFRVAFSSLVGYQTNFAHKLLANFTDIELFVKKGIYFKDTRPTIISDLAATSSIKLFSVSNIDTSSAFREIKFFNPSIKYNYKSGDYFPKFSKETYTYLFSILSDLGSLTKLTSWYKASSYPTFVSNNVENFFEFISFYNENDLVSKKWNLYVFGASEGFYNFFFELSKNLTLMNFQYVSVLNVQQKFYKMFHTNSFQQRILSNWRQLKFTREAWRCKLLSSRHQKTLFRRYTHEDGVFWSIERNAKDLLPGWAMITPFSSRTRFTAVGKTDIGLMGVLLVLNSSIISAANFLVTYRYLSTLNNRKMRDARAFFTEGVMVSSWMMVTANPMLVIGIIMLLSDRHWQTSFFDYSGGGDTVLFQHMFWFFGHPEVYIIIIPTFGFTNTMLSFYFRKRVSARASLLYSMYTIAFLGFFVWGHHMYMVGLAHTTRMLFSTLTVMISVPAATKIMHWCVTFVNSSFATELPLLFILTFIFFFVSGGISGMCVAHTGMDVLFHDTFYVIGHFHVMLAGAAMFASFGAFYFYFPAIFGVKYSRLYAYLHYTYYLIGQLMTVIPMFWLGYAGMPRRVLDYPASMGGWHSVISAGHMLSVAGLMSFFIMIFDSLRQGRAVIRNTFGISRYNTRLNFYLYSIGQHIYAQQKGLFLFKFNKPGALKLNKLNYKNHEPLETTLLSYSFFIK